VSESLVRVAHASMQYSDSSVQHTSDANKIFERLKARNIRWVTGTESGGSAGNTASVLTAAAEKFGYRYFGVNKTDSWVAVQKTFIAGEFEGHYVELFPGKAHVHPSRGILWTSFTHKSLGRITVGTGHYMTKGRKPGDPFFVQNVRYMDAVNEWARGHGFGKALVFYGGDQNMIDRDSDTFHGGPLTSLWDELHKYESTGHGNIDVIASYNYDARVKGAAIDAMTDAEFPLFTDHFLVEGAFKIQSL
jgi:hypothetical protein